MKKKKSKRFETQAGHYKPIKIKKGYNETTLQDYSNNNRKPLKEGDIFWMVNLGGGAGFDCERQEDAEIISRLIRVEKLLKKLINKMR